MSEFDMKLLIEELQERNDNLNKENNKLSLENQRLYNLLDKIIEESQEHKIPKKIENRIDDSFIDFNYSERMRLTEIVDKINEILDYLRSQNES